MKRIALIVFLSFVAIKGFGQINYFGIYGGAGLGTSNNYNAGLSGGLSYLKTYSLHSGLGANLFYQSYAIAYDNEAYGVKGGKGNAGVQMLHQSAYVFLTPKFDCSIDRTQAIHFFVTAGVGFNMGGSESLRKWDHSYGSTQSNYDSTLDTSPNVTKLLLRVGTGFTEYLWTGRHWAFTFTQDFGFMLQNLSSTAEYVNPSRTVYFPHSMKPGYISLQIGITHIGYHSN